MAGHSDLNPEHREKRREHGGEGTERELLIGCADIHYNRLLLSGDEEGECVGGLELRCERSAGMGVEEDRSGGRKRQMSFHWAALIR